MPRIKQVKKKIKAIISLSSVPEDPVHAENTLKWLLYLLPDADEALQIAALGHDIERAIEDRKVRRQDYSSYDEFKKAHAVNSSIILKEVLSKFDLPSHFIEDVCNLVRHHEFGGFQRANLLRDADSISFFEVNLPYYFLRHNEEGTKRRFMWGYKKLSEELKKLVRQFKYENPHLQMLVKNWSCEFL